MRHLPSLIVPGAVVLCVFGCATSAPPEAQLYKEGASHQDFSRDRRACILEAQQRLSGPYNAVYGFSATHTMPSSSAYLKCMSSRGYRQVESGGFVPQAAEQMIP